MANNQNLIDLSKVEALPCFAGLSNPLPFLHGHGPPAADWDDTHIHNITVWHNTQLGDDNIITIGQAFLSDIRDNRISMRTSASGLKLSMSLKSMEPGRTAPLLSQRPRGEAEVAMPELDQFGDTPFTLRNPPGAPPILQVPIPGEDTVEKKTRAYTFIAAYLMRLLVKDAGNAVSGLANMKQRFESFYGRSRIVTSFVITLQQAAVYKEALRSQVMISNTYTLAFAYTQNAASANHSPREKNLLCYLAYLPFSYTGLLAYTMMANLKNFTNVEMGALLTLFHVDINKPALNKIADIIRRYERTVTNPARSTYFRYCALWGAHYFKQLRSKNCPHLIYTASCAWKVLSPANENADPDRIMATRTLSDSMKRTLKVAGNIIGESLKSVSQIEG